MLFYTLVLQFYLGKRKEEDSTFLRKKTRRITKQCYMMTPVNETGQFFQWS